MQTDFSLTAAWELCVLHGIAPKSHLSDAYELHIALILNYLAKLDNK